MSLQTHLHRLEQILAAPPPSCEIDAAARLAVGRDSIRALRRHLIRQDLSETRDVHDSATRDEPAV